MAIRTISFDVDGCLFNSKYLRSNDKEIVTHNQELLDQLKKNNDNYQKTIVFIGSNRQSKTIDDVNAIDKGSCFLPLLEVAKYLEADFDPFLLADLYENLDEGTSLSRALSNSYKGNHAQWLFDETKLTVLYAQIHKTAKQNSSEAIEYHFYDDRSRLNGTPGLEILDCLHSFFSKYPHMLPKNVTLCLHHYKGKDVTPYPEIEGVGLIDRDYSRTVKEMAWQALGQVPEFGQNDKGFEPYYDQTIDTALIIDPSQLTREKPVRVSQGSLFKAQSSQDTALETTQCWCTFL